MNCKECKNLIVIRIYGKLNPNQEQELNSHLKECPRCERILQEYKDHSAVLMEKEEAELPDWDKSWRTIAAGVFPQPKPQSIVFPIKKLAFVVSAFVIVFVLGFFAGKQYLFRPQGFSSPEMLASESSGTSLQRYAEDLQPILTGFLNRTFEAGDTEAARLAEIEALLIQDMLIQTRLLKLLAAQAEEPHVNELLEDLELILIGMANLRFGDKESLQQLQEIIREKELKFKLRAFIQPDRVM